MPFAEEDIGGSSPSLLTACIAIRAAGDAERGPWV
jgi:hypothetical protein